MKGKHNPERMSWNCALCSETSFKTFGTAPELKAHVAAEHGVIIEPGAKLRRVPVAFLDGRSGSAQQIHNWFLPDGRPLCTSVWSSGDFATPYLRPDGEVEP